MKLSSILLASALVMAPMTAMAAGKTVGFSQIGSESGWRAAETTVTKQQAEERGVDLKFADAQQKQENQIKALRGFIAQGVDAIFLAPVCRNGFGILCLKKLRMPKFLSFCLTARLMPIQAFT